MVHNADLDAAAYRQDPQLLELFQLLQWLRRQTGQFHQKRAAIGIQPQVLEELRRRPAEIGLPVTDMGNRAAAKVERPATAVAHYFHAVWVAPLVQRGDGHG